MLLLQCDGEQTPISAHLVLLVEQTAEQLSSFQREDRDGQVHADDHRRIDVVRAGTEQIDQVVVEVHSGEMAWVFGCNGCMATIDRVRRWMLLDDRRTMIVVPVGHRRLAKTLDFNRHSFPRSKATDLIDPVVLHHRLHD